MADIVIQLLPHILASLIYAGLGYHFWHTRWRCCVEQSVARPMQTWERLAIAGALIPHAIGLAESTFSEGSMNFSFGLALSLMMWLAVLIYWLESFLARMEGMQPLVLSLAAACALTPVLFSTTHLIPNAGALPFKLHFLTAMLAYSLLALAALQAIFMGFTESALHRRLPMRSLNSLPPLMTMERLLFRMLTAGFILLSLTVGSGIFFAEFLFGKPFALDHKTIFALVSWLIFATLLLGRHAWGWRGRRALRWTLAGFGVLLLAYMGSRFVAEVILGRI